MKASSIERGEEDRRKEPERKGHSAGKKIAKGRILFGKGLRPLFQDKVKDLRSRAIAAFTA
ncbi:MAG TPA: hypothetical protein DDZ04_06680 [Parabacteroides sp.]|nr:hypothetical protein [Parabacteroides sp.]